MTNYCQRFPIKEDNAFKTLDLHHSNIEIKNEKENGKLIIALSSIIEIMPVKESQTEIKMIYNSNGNNKPLIFSCEERSNLLSKVIGMKDKNSKIISDYSIETFKCYLIINMDTQKKILLKDIGQKLADNMNNKNDINKESLNKANADLNQYIKYCTLYRTYWVANQLSYKEIKNNYVSIQKIIKIQIVPGVYEIKYEEKQEYLKESPIIDLSLNTRPKSTYIQNNNIIGDKRIPIGNQNKNLKLKELNSINFKKFQNYILNQENAKENKLHDYFILNLIK